MFTREDANQRGTKLRDILKDLGHDISHTHVLEAVARMQGYRDWNTCAAALDVKSQILPIPNGWHAGGDRREHYDIGLDRAARYDGSNAAVIRYRSNAPKEATGFATFTQSFDAELYRGKRLRFSCKLRTEDVEGAVTIWLRADSSSRNAIAFDNLEGNGIGNANGPMSGTADWSDRTIVLDIPATAERISMGYYLRGQGAAYAAGFSVEVVSQDVPVTTATRSGEAEPVNLSVTPKG